MHHQSNAESAPEAASENEKELIPGTEVVHGHALLASVINLTYLTTRLLEGLIKLIKELL